MTDFKQQYKNPRLGFGDADHNRFLRAYKQDKSRREIRTRVFDRNRHIENVSSASPHAFKDERMKKLMKWKEERKRKQQLENAKKKPVFKVSVVHHALYSPKGPVATTKLPKQAKNVNNVPKGITKATQKRLLTKATIAKQQIAKNTLVKSLTKQPVNINTFKTSTLNIKNKESFAPVDHEFKPPSGLPKMPLFGLVAVEQTPSEKGDFFIQDRPMECKAHDTNTQKVVLSSDSTSVVNTTATASNTDSIVLLNKLRSRQTSDKIIHNSNDTTSKLNEVMAKKLSSNEQMMDNSAQEENPSSNNTYTETPLRKTSSPNKSSESKNCNQDLIVFSPYLTLSRGKRNARREQQLRLGIGSASSDKIPTKDTVMKNLNISVEEEERTAQYFKFLLNKETNRLKELCEKWTDIRQQKGIPEDAVYEMNQAVGQTNLLISKKFERFRCLVLDCETGKGEMLVTCRDLQGFWDMAYMEVRDCDSRFEKLEQRRNRGWQEEEQSTIKPVAKKRVSAKKQIVSSKPSSLRSMIAAKRKKMAGTPKEEDLLLRNATINKGRITPPLSSRRYAAFKENSDKRNMRSKSIDRSKSTPARYSNTKASLVQKMQSSDVSKRLESPFTIMKISQMCKTPEVQLDDTISYVNSDQTPGKSILKKTEELADKEACIKSAHKVNFDDQVLLDEVPVDEEMQTKLDLAAALNRIDSLDLDDLTAEECIRAEKRLAFETEDSDTSDTLDLMFEVQRQLGKEDHKSKWSAQDASKSDDPHPFAYNDITCTIPHEESSVSDNVKGKSLRRSSRHQARRKNSMNDMMEIPFINVSSATPVVPKIVSNAASTEQGYESEIKILRNRVITTGDTPKTTTKMMTSNKRTGKKENKSPIKSSRKSSLKSPRKSYRGSTYMLSDEVNITEIKENVDRRKSSRKSVAFDVESCVACAESKPVLPMTPHSKRRTSKTSMKQNRDRNAIEEDLISWKTPERPPSRVTRSHAKN